MSDTTNTFEILDPATEETIATLPDATVQDALDALTSAVEVQKAWAKVPPQRRADLLNRIAEVVD